MTAGHLGAFVGDLARAIEALQVMWQGVYDVGLADGACHATRLDGTGQLLTAPTPAELAAAIMADRSAWAAGYVCPLRGDDL